VAIFRELEVDVALFPFVARMPGADDDWDVYYERGKPKEFIT